MGNKKPHRFVCKTLVGIILLLSLFGSGYVCPNNCEKQRVKTELFLKHEAPEIHSFKAEQVSKTQPSGAASFCFREVKDNRLSPPFLVSHLEKDFICQINTILRIHSRKVYVTNKFHFSSHYYSAEDDLISFLG